MTKGLSILLAFSPVIAFTQGSDIRGVVADAATGERIPAAAGQTNSGSLRLDEPDYANIPGGLGVFGSSSEQTSSVDLTQSPSSSSLLLECKE
jgi:hypothetical protein